MKKVWLILLFCLVLGMVPKAHAQHSPADSILLGAVVEGKDTIAMIFLPDVIVREKMLKRFAKKKAENDRLRYNVYKVYPYAVMAAEVLKDVDVNLARIGDDKKARKAYLKTVEKELNAKFKGELQNLTITQGQILVRLINRQTGKNCYGIIQELKGGFSAVLAQSLAMLFSNNLKREYDATGRDADIEVIVKELEAKNYTQYYYQRQQQLQRKN